MVELSEGTFSFTKNIKGTPREMSRSSFLDLKSLGLLLPADHRKCQIFDARPVFLTFYGSYRVSTSYPDMGPFGTFVQHEISFRLVHNVSIFGRRFFDVGSPHPISRSKAIKYCVNDHMFF